jgi:pyruvate,orthophosphate dikinase
MNEVFFVGARRSDDGLTAEVVGNKAANLARLERLGLPVPPALALSTGFCRAFAERGCKLPDGFQVRLAGSIRQLEEATGLALGHRRPLLLSVRSSPGTSMPGMLDTVLNVGLTEQTVQAFIRHTGNPWLAWDSYRRLILSFAEVVFAVDPAPFHALTASYLAAAHASSLDEVDPLSLRSRVQGIGRSSGADDRLPLARDPLAQVVDAVEAVLRS